MGLGMLECKLYMGINLEVFLFFNFHAQSLENCLAYSSYGKYFLCVSYEFTHLSFPSWKQKALSLGIKQHISQIKINHADRGCSHHKNPT